MMRNSRVTFDLLVLPAVLLVAAATWLLHAQAWDLGGRSPIINYDTAQYALAGRELAWHGRLATPYALPVELQSRSGPPWPLAVVQPGLVVVEGALFKLLPFRSSDARAWLTVLLPFCCFLMLAASLALSVRHLFARWWPEAPAVHRIGAALTLGLAFALDPEAQHFATGGFTELPFTLGLLFAFLGLALEAPAKVPLRYGLVMGLTGLFRANMLWLAPLFALGAAMSVERGRRLSTLLRVLAGFALPLAPWWYYKWRAFGSPTYDLTKYVVWDGVQGRSWFSLYHRPAAPDLPHGAEAGRLLLAKLLANVPKLLGALLSGPRGLWLGAIAGWLVLVRPPRPLAAAGLVALAASALGVATAAVSIPWLRYVFPTRILVEPIGVLALWALLARLPAGLVRDRDRRAVLALGSLVAIAWGAWNTSRGLTEARATSYERGVPATESLTMIGMEISRRLPPGEPVMSNLGPALAWQSLHPVVHLALTPEDVALCRRQLDFRAVLLVFRDERATWPGWTEVFAHPGWAETIPSLAVREERRYLTPDGFRVVWLELGPQGPALAAAR